MDNTPTESRTRGFVIVCETRTGNSILEDEGSESVCLVSSRCRAVAGSGCGGQRVDSRGSEFVGRGKSLSSKEVQIKR